MVERKIATFEENIRGMNKRDAFATIKSFVEGNECYKGRILAIYGLRRTGKTTLMEQVLCEANIDMEASIFLEMQEKDTMADLEKRIIEEQARGKSVIVIDEITKASDFINNSAVLSDCFAKEGLKIIVAGTDSLSIIFAEEGELYDRTLKVNTTYISFAEHCRVLQTNDMDDYIEYGGLMKKSGDEKIITDYESMLKYLDSAVSSNIANSLKNNSRLDERDVSLKKLSRSELRSIVEKVTELYSGKINRAICEEQLKSVMLNSANHKLVDIADKEIVNTLVMKKKEIAEEFAQIINADEKINVSVTPQMIEELERWLKTLNLLSVVEERTFEKTMGSWDVTPPVFTYYIVQPAIKYNHLRKAMEYVQESDKYCALNEHQKEEYMKFLDEKVKGDMTEQIVVFDVMNSLPQNRYKVCKPKFKINNNTVGEYDMLIYDKHEDKYWGFEIKHTSNPFNDCDENGRYIGQDKALINPEIKEIVDEHYGNRENVCVLYNGTPFTAPTGTEYYNISDFLIAVDKYRDMDMAMRELKNLTRNLSKATTPTSLFDVAENHGDIDAEITSKDSMKNSAKSTKKAKRQLERD